MIDAVNGKSPRIDPSAFVAPGAVVVGDVELGPNVSIWYGCVLRGDVNFIKVGEASNIQDGSIIHVTHHGNGTTVGRGVMVGHRVILHGCTIEDSCLIGMGAVVLDGVRVETGAVVAAGSVVPPGMVVPARTMVAGVPAAPKREISDQELLKRRESVARYIKMARCHQDRGLPLDELLKS